MCTVTMLLYTITSLLLVGCRAATEYSNGLETRTPNSSHFHMSFDTTDTKLRRRDTTYITDEGYVTTDRNQATVFYISNSQLCSDGDHVSADSIDPYIPFAVNSIQRSISTVWTPGFLPTWSNRAFAGDGIARYCLGSDTRVYIVLQSSPAVCTPVVASTIPFTSTTAASTRNTTSSTSVSVNQVAEATSIIQSGSYQSFCSNYLGYTTPVATQTVAANITDDATVTASSGVTTVTVNTTIYQTQTVPTTTIDETITPSVSTVTTTTTTLIAVTHTAAPLKRDLFSPPRCQECEEKKARRGIATTNSSAIPSPLSTFPPNILSSACSLEASSVTVTTTTTTTATRNQTIFFSTTVPSSTQTVVFNTTDIATVSEGNATVVTTATSTPVTTVTETDSQTTTITVAANAPSGVITYLAVDPPINAGARFALSDPATHMTDNYYDEAKREVFIVTSTGQLYSVTNQAYYYPNAASANKLFWSTVQSDGSTLFYSTVNSTNGETQLFLREYANGPAYVFCVATLASADGNSATGLHVHFYASPSDFPSTCLRTNLFLVPTT